MAGHELEEPRAGRAHAVEVAAAEALLGRTMPSIDGGQVGFDRQLPRS